MIEWLTMLADFLGASRYAAHSLCLTSDRNIIGMFVLSDTSIGLAYFGIMTVLYVAYIDRVRVMRVARILLGDPIFLKWFAAFIGCCGLTHFTMVLTLFYGVYYLDVLARLVTAAVSVITACRLIYVSLWPPAETNPFAPLLDGPVPVYESRPLHLPNPALRPGARD